MLLADQARLSPTRIKLLVVKKKFCFQDSRCVGVKQAIRKTICIPSFLPTRHLVCISCLTSYGKKLRLRTVPTPHPPLRGLSDGAEIPGLSHTKPSYFLKPHPARGCGERAGHHLGRIREGFEKRPHVGTRNPSIGLFHQ